MVLSGCRASQLRFCIRVTHMHQINQSRHSKVSRIPFLILRVMRRTEQLSQRCYLCSSGSPHHMPCISCTPPNLGYLRLWMTSCSLTSGHANANDLGLLTFERPASRPTKNIRPSWQSSSHSTLLSSWQNALTNLARGLRGLLSCSRTVACSRSLSAQKAVPPFTSCGLCPWDSLCISR